jgi:uncharacterized protein
MKKITWTIAAMNGTTVATQAMIASSIFQKTRGLLGKRHLHPQEAMIFYHASSIHTVGMRFAIDIIFVKKSGEILRIESGVQPGRFLLCPSFATIELPENRSLEKKLEKGNILKWFQNEESGQVFVEYALILSLLVIGMLIAFTPLMERVQEFLHSIIGYLIDI